MVVEFLQNGFLQFRLLRTSLHVLAQETVPTTMLPEPVRQIAYMALLGIALLGMLMIVATLLGGHWVRRWGDRLRRPAVPPDMIIPKRPRIDLHGGISEGHSDDDNNDDNNDHNNDHSGGDMLGPEETRV